MLILLALLLAQATSANPPQLPIPVNPSSGCGTTPPFTGLTTQNSGLSLTTDGDGTTTRSVLVRVGTAYVNTTPAPLVFVVHEAGGTSAGADGWGISQAATPAANWISLMPQGIASQTFGVGWNSALPYKLAKDAYSECGGCTPPQTARDVLWVDNMVAYMEAHFCIDMNRIFAAGFSWGGDFVTSLACGRGYGGSQPGFIHTFRAISVSAAGGDFVPDQSGNFTDYLNWKGLNGCPTYAGIRHVYDDSGGDGTALVPDLFMARDLYKAINKCSPQSSRVSSCNEWAACASPTVDCPVHALGHARPVTWGADTVAFFQRF